MNRKNPPTEDAGRALGGPYKVIDFLYSYITRILRNRDGDLHALRPGGPRRISAFLLTPGRVSYRPPLLPALWLAPAAAAARVCTGL